MDDADIHQYMREKREEKIFKWKRLSEQIHKLTRKIMNKSANNQLISH